MDMEIGFDLFNMCRKRDGRWMSRENNVNKSLAIAVAIAVARWLSCQVNCVKTAPAEPGNADGEVCGLCLAQLGEEVRDSRHCDALTVLVYERAESKYRSDEIVAVPS